MCACTCIMLSYISMSYWEELEHHVKYKRSNNKLESRDNIIIAKWSVQSSWCKLILFITPCIDCYGYVHKLFTHSCQLRKKD